MRVLKSGNALEETNPPELLNLISVH